jgi:hypothetical protein
MKLILSRKGFDAANGGVPSPILPDGSLCPLPILSDERPCLKDVAWRGQPLSRIVSAITNRQIAPSRGVHLDPDLQKDARPRARRWQPAFGQVGPAAAHLANRGVGVGDLFLFFGWFRRTSRLNGRLTFDRTAPDLHVVFGWLQVGRILHPTADMGSVPRWAAEHPHVRRARSMALNNTLYVASSRLASSTIAGCVFGAGVFPRLSSALSLTAQDQNRSHWRLPRWFYPTPGKLPLSYHADPARWSLDRAGCFLQTVGRGQEFVLDCDHYPEALDWIREIFAGLG